MGRRSNPKDGEQGVALGQDYVGRILAKLGLRSRVQAVVLASEHGLVRPSSNP